MPIFLTNTQFYNYFISPDFSRGYKCKKREKIGPKLQNNQSCGKTVAFNQPCIYYATLSICQQRLKNINYFLILPESAGKAPGQIYIGTRHIKHASPAQNRAISRVRVPDSPSADHAQTYAARTHPDRYLNHLSS